MEYPQVDRTHDGEDMNGVLYKVAYQTTTERIIYIELPSKVRMYILQVKLPIGSPMAAINATFEAAYHTKRWASVIDLASNPTKYHLGLYEFAARRIMARVDEVLLYGFTFDKGRMIVHMPT